MVHGWRELPPPHPCNKAEVEFACFASSNSAGVAVTIQRLPGGVKETAISNFNHCDSVVISLAEHRQTVRPAQKVGGGL